MVLLVKSIIEMGNIFIFGRLETIFNSRMTQHIQMYFLAYKYIDLVLDAYSTIHFICFFRRAGFMGIS